MDENAGTTPAKATQDGKEMNSSENAGAEGKAPVTMDIPDFIRMEGLKKGRSRAEKPKRRRALGRTGSLSSSSSASPASSGPPSPRDDDDGGTPAADAKDDEEMQGAERKLDSLRVDPNNSPPRRHVRFCMVPNEIPEPAGVSSKRKSVEKEEDADSRSANNGSEGGGKEGTAQRNGTEGMETEESASKKKESAHERDKKTEASQRKQFEWDDVGMDSSGDDDELGEVGKESEDLYDPDMDDLDQQFVDNRRRRHLPGYSAALKHGPPRPKKPKNTAPDHPDPAAPAQGGEGGGEWKAYVAPNGFAYYHNPKTNQTTWTKPDGFEGDNSALQGPALRTDAVLSCPCCFALVCLDCQQHASFHHQYRAVFVQNCQVLRGEALQTQAPPGLEGMAPDTLAPVRCKSCQAEIGVMDGEEVFHFFDVIPSNG